MKVQIPAGSYTNMFSALNTNGGHIMVGFGLMAIGAVFFKLGIPKADEALVVGMTLITRAMMDGGPTLDTKVTNIDESGKTTSAEVKSGS